MSRDIDFQTVLIRGEERLEIRVLTLEQAGCHGKKWTWTVGNSERVYTSTGPFHLLSAQIRLFEPTAVEFRMADFTIRREREAWLREEKALHAMETRLRDDVDDDEIDEPSWTSDTFANLVAAKIVSMEVDLFVAAYREELHGRRCQVIRARDPTTTTVG